MAGVRAGRSPAGSARGWDPGPIRERPAVRPSIHPSAGPARALSLLARPPRPRDAGFRARNWGGDVPKVTAPGRWAWSQGLPQASGSGPPEDPLFFPDRPPPTPARAHPPIHPSIHCTDRPAPPRAPLSQQLSSWRPRCPVGVHVARPSGKHRERFHQPPGPGSQAHSPPASRNPGSWHSAPQPPPPSAFPPSALGLAAPAPGPRGSPSFRRTRRFQGPLTLQRPARQAVSPLMALLWFPLAPWLQPCWVSLSLPCLAVHRGVPQILASCLEEGRRVNPICEGMPGKIYAGQTSKELTS